MQTIFHVEGLNIIEWVAVMIFAILIFILAELDKLIMVVRHR